MKASEPRGANTGCYIHRRLETLKREIFRAMKARTRRPSGRSDNDGDGDESRSLCIIITRLIQFTSNYTPR